MNPIFIVLVAFGLLAIVEYRQNMDRAPVVTSTHENGAA